MKSIQELFDYLNKDIQGNVKQVPINSNCELCENPDYKGINDLYYNYDYCPKCGAILMTLEDYLDEEE